MNAIQMQQALFKAASDVNALKRQLGNSELRLRAAQISLGTLLAWCERLWVSVPTPPGFVLVGDDPSAPPRTNLPGFDKAEFMAYLGDVLRKEGFEVKNAAPGKVREEGPAVLGPDGKPLN